jgi:hypothetical protein
VELPYFDKCVIRILCKGDLQVHSSWGAIGSQGGVYDDIIRVLSS